VALELSGFRRKGEPKYPVQTHCKVWRSLGPVRDFTEDGAGEFGITDVISSQYSPLHADGLSKGKIDAALLRREKGLPGLAFRVLVKEPLMVTLPNDHRLAALKAVRPRDLAGEAFVIASYTAPVLRAVIDDYLKRSGVNITPAHEANHVSMGIP
jgi:DNA-binding transcriptional LysR family regulator